MGKGRIGETEKILRKRGQEGGGLVKNISGGGGNLKFDQILRNGSVTLDETGFTKNFVSRKIL